MSVRCMGARMMAAAGVVVAAMAGLVRAEDGVAIGNPAGGVVSPSAAQANPATSPQLIPTGSPAQAAEAMDPAIKINYHCPPMCAALMGATDARVDEILTNWVTAYNAEYGSIHARYRELAMQIYKETDPAKKTELKTEAAEVLARFPTTPQNYISIREALKAVLSEEQLAELDVKARDYTTRGTVAAVESFVRTVGEAFKKANPPTPWTDAQKESIKLIEDRTREAAEKLPLGTRLGNRDMMDIVAAANREIIVNVMTDEQVATIPETAGPRSR